MGERKIRLLLVEDERAFAWVLADTLSTSGFEVCNAYDGEEALRQARAFSPEIIVTDIMMPKMDGFRFVRRLREERIMTPVLFLSARTDPEDVVRGFELGAGDYIRKPFAIKELIVRVRSLLGREKECVEPMERRFHIGCFIFDALSHKLEFGDNGMIEEISLPTRESEILAMLCGSIGEVVPNVSILSKLWGNDDYFCLRSLNVHVTRLRKKLSRDSRITIDSFRGVGYRLLVH